MSELPCIWCRRLLQLYGEVRQFGFDEASALKAVPLALMGHRPFALEDDGIVCAFHAATSTGATARLEALHG